MAGRIDPVEAELKAIRRRFSRRLRKAYDEGRLREEIAAIERQGRRALREAANGHHQPGGNGKSAK